MRDELLVRLLCMEILKQPIYAAKQDLQLRHEQYRIEHKNSDYTNNAHLQTEIENLCEGGESGEIVPGMSHVYAVFNIPVPFKQELAAKNSTSQSFFSILAEDNSMLVASGLQCVEDLTTLC
ncbi:uncharacterized protein [Eurosta solidaginis]|uniref:uncharacterized protein n=1 Tax=Eurosta solidaginis TaxID=178769 RepID=UPI003530CB4A